MALNIGLFSIQPGVMPFQMDFLAFVISFLVLSLLVSVLWVIIYQWDTLVALLCYARHGFDGIVHKFSKNMSRSTDEVESRNQRSIENSNFTGEIAQVNGISTVPRVFFRDRFLVRRRDRGETSGAAGHC